MKRTTLFTFVVFLLLLCAPVVFGAMRGSGGGGDGGGAGGGGAGGGAGGGGGGGPGGVRTGPANKLITISSVPVVVSLFSYDIVDFVINNLKYRAKLGVISPDKAVLTLGSVTESLLVGKPVALDVNKDTKADVLVTLSKTSHNVATFEIVLASAVSPVAVAAAVPVPSVSGAAVAEAGSAGTVVGEAVAAGGSGDDFVQVEKQTTSVGGFSFSNKIISGALLLVVAFVIFKFWKRHGQRTV